MSGGKIKKLKERISTISSIGRISKVMEVTSKAKLPKYKKMVQENREFHHGIEDLIFDLVNNGYDIKNNKYLKKVKNKKELIIVISSDLGMAGSYNINVFKKIKDILKNDKNIENIDFISIGKKSNKFISNITNKNINLIKNYELDINSWTEEHLKEVTEEVIKLFETNSYQAIEVIYSKIISNAHYEVSRKKLLPLDINFDNKEKKINKAIDFQADKNELLEMLVKLHLDSNIYYSIVNSITSEELARNIAMENAVKSSKDLQNNLKIELNLARKSKITQEINEIISGFESTNQNEVM